MTEQETSSMAQVTPAKARRARPTRIGVVTSDKSEKTIAVTISFHVRHRKYGKFIRRRTRLQVHDPADEARLGDKVEIMECRPVSRTKSWRLVRVIERAPSEVRA